MVLILPILLAIPFLWLLSIRPYCIRNGEGYTPGINIVATMWVDWHQASEISAENGDSGMRWICRTFLILHLLGFGTLLAPLFEGILKAQP